MLHIIIRSITFESATKLPLPLNQDPKHILFKEVRPLKSGQYAPLFKSQRELAEAIIDSGAEYKDADSLTPFLSNIFKPGDHPGSKPIPKKMLESILGIARERLPEPDFGAFKYELSTAFEYLKSTNVRLTNPTQTWIKLNYWMVKARYHHIITHTPAELNWEDHQQAKDLVLFLFKNLLIPENDPRVIFFMFYVPNFATGVKFWTALRKYVQNESNVFESLMAVDDFLENISNKRRIVVSEIGFSECAIPISFFQTADVTERALFSMSYNKDEEYTVIQFSEKETEFWYDNKLLPIIMDSRALKEIPYSSVINTLYKYEPERT